MGFMPTPYTAPDFSKDLFSKAPNVIMKESPGDAVAPEGYHAMSIYPEYFKIDGRWLLAEESRMDCVPVYENGKVEVREFRLLKKGEIQSKYIGKRYIIPKIYVIDYITRQQQ